MSRIGNRELIIPAGITIDIEDKILKVKGKKGELTLIIPANLTVNIADNILRLKRKKEDLNTKKIHGTINALIRNMIIGITDGFEKNLEIVGVGYRFQLNNNKLLINAGYSHQIEINIPQGIEVDVIGNTEIRIKGIDKQLVGEFAANIRKIRKPEPYKGKGIRYKGEKIRRKAGKKDAK